ncbi:hypothetical protein JCM10212_002388 [Sporobolomyces blumeae]
MAKLSSAARSAVYRPPLWINLWFLVSSVLVAWDIGFVLNRPRSFKGGDLHWWWSPYALYEVVDLVYSPGAFSRRDGFNAAQTYMNIVETFLNLTFLVSSARKSPVAILVGFTAVLMTASKTVLYWLVDYHSGWAATGHNSQKDWWLLFALPNGFWIIVPTILVFVFGNEIAKSLRVAAKQKVL